MGRFPFLAYVNQFIAVVPWNDDRDSTKDTERRALRHIYQDFNDLEKEGRVKTSNPQKFDAEDINHWMTYRRKQVGPGMFQKDLQRLKTFLPFVGNPVMQQMKAKQQLPRITRTAIEQEISIVNDQDLDEARERAEHIRGWWGSVCRFILWFYPNAGCRPSEGRRALLSDLDTQNWTFYVRHPKGEKSYGQKRTTTILPPARPHILRFLKERAEMLQRKGGEEPELVPKQQGYGPFCAQRYRVIRNCATQGKFTTRDLRPTFAQNAVDMGVSIKSVAKLLGHSTTNTTERYYARFKNNAAINEINEAFESSTTTRRKKKVPEPLIDPGTV